MKYGVAGSLSWRCSEEEGRGVDEEEASCSRSLCSCARYACTSALAGVSGGGLGEGARDGWASVNAAADALLLIVLFVLEPGEVLGEVTRDPDGFRRRTFRGFSGFPEVLLSFGGAETGDLSISWG